MSLPFSPLCRLAVPLGLRLAVLFWSAPALPVAADPPTAPAVASSAVQTQTIFLQHAALADIGKALFREGRDILPAGVTQLSFRPDTNSLVVVATPAGLAKVQEIVKILDIAPRQVQIKFALANATAADLDASGINFTLVPYPGLEIIAKPGVDSFNKTGRPTFLLYATGKDIALFLLTLTKQGAVTQSPVITTSNNVSATLTVNASGPQASSATFAVTPRVNSDDSVTLDLHPVFQEGTEKREVKTLRTVKSGDTMVIVMPPAAHAAGSKSLLLFVTPTIIGSPIPSAAP